MHVGTGDAKINLTFCPVCSIIAATASISMATYSLPYLIHTTVLWWYEAYFPIHS